MEHPYLLSTRELLLMVQNDPCQPEYVMEIQCRQEVMSELKMNVVKSYNLRTSFMLLDEHDLEYYGIEPIIIEVMCQSNFSIIQRQ